MDPPPKTLKLDWDAISQKISAIIVSLWQIFEHYIVTQEEPSRSINRKIESLLLQGGPDRRQTNNDTKHGCIYILTGNHDGTPIIKIGHTTAAADARTGQQMRACRDLGFRQLDHGIFPVRGAHYKLVERLVHEELRDRRRLFLCSCGKRHREIFAVADPDLARRAVRRWIRFCEKEPWRYADNNPAATTAGGRPGGRRIRKHWRDRLDRRRARIHGSADGGDDLEARMRLWDGFVEPGCAETLREHVHLALLVATLLYLCFSNLMAGYVWLAMVVLFALAMLLLYATRHGYEELRDCYVENLLYGSLGLLGVFSVCVGQDFAAFAAVVVFAGVVVCGFVERLWMGW
ncbi:hypothetical protein N658DRAFT_523336 [Parathielavia hyrcaniae]|uniref:Bacteriophage T5 Orf172 DNA-binding domain-containing protein n=1 Tax=Parathielavia hyrcaniae TaxID=113614 RepID=A0AAN6Q727_9PEZI|nr:hypothetical protein N658DRAFT_523336 [Parathielavia hyrcaniae]